MKRLGVFLLALAMLFTLAACGSSSNQGSSAAAGTADKPLKVALLINGTLGDKSFNDSAANGMKMIDEQLPNVKTKVVEMTTDDTKWEPDVLDAIDEGNDIIISGTWQMQDVIAKIAPEYPNVKFIVYDTSMDYSNGAFPNVYSIEYKQCDGSFLAGVLAASMSQSKQIGFVGGMDNTVIYDFLVGYIQGAQAVDSSIKVTSSFVGNFTDSARAKELATSQYNMGTDIIFSCASNAGDGTMQAGKDLGKYVIGVDSDQAKLYQDTDPVLAKLIPTSVLKRVDISLLQAVKAAQEGNLAWGTSVSVGIAENCIGLADNDIYQSIVPQKTRDLIDQYTKEIKDGSITVKSAFDMSTDELTAFVNSAK